MDQVFKFSKPTSRHTLLPARPCLLRPTPIALLTRGHEFKNLSPLGTFLFKPPQHVALGPRYIIFTHYSNMMFCPIPIFNLRTKNVLTRISVDTAETNEMVKTGLRIRTSESKIGSSTHSERGRQSIKTIENMVVS